MIDCYRRMAKLSPDDGLHVVMFTHQSADVWADLALILWTADLRVSAAWTVQTETMTVGLKQGNYVQGTVLLVLRKRIGGAFENVGHEGA
jgi:adenine-specific DNA methylase